ncbi:DUF1214 domain-containing protein [Nocardia asteroides]|uniref:DUF1214 domain-containing protein n=1 Tax=Nocardia asteroides TaxID=1824 RepID=UPI0034463197
MGTSVPNSVDRFKIGNRDTDLHIDFDGNLSITVLPTEPAAANANWLLSPADGTGFYLMYCAYLPVPTGTDGAYRESASLWVPATARERVGLAGEDRQCGGDFVQVGFDVGVGRAGTLAVVSGEGSGHGVAEGPFDPGQGGVA